MSSRVVKAVHGVQQVTQDPADEIAESARLREREPREALGKVSLLITETEGAVNHADPAVRNDDR
ncbi:MAG: hypothetical protein AABM40_01845 [Chloroflexota bacterium]